MIPRADIVEWRNAGHPWKTDAQVEQDLILSRMLVELFRGGTLAEKLIFRGGTALHKLILPRPVRYSEDLDFVQSMPGPIGPIFDEIRSIFDGWLGKPRRKIGPGVVNLVYRVASEDTPPLPLRVKIEINTREHFQIWPIEQREIQITSRWFTGAAVVPVYRAEELLATKMRALYQRRKGRDLFDLAEGLRQEGVSPESIAAAFIRYSENAKQKITANSFRANLAEKLAHPGFLTDCPPLLLAGVRFNAEEDRALVDRELISRIDGN